MWIKKIASRIRNALIKKKDDTLVYNSTIQYPSLIKKSSRIEHSTLSGQITVGECCWINNVSMSGEIVIGNHTTINGPNTDIYTIGKDKVIVGNFTSIARSVSIQNYNHIYDRITHYFIRKNMFKEDISKDIISKGDLVIGNDVWIGAQTVILPGITIGDGAVIGANSTVTRDIPPYSIVAGSPATEVKQRFSPEIIATLLNIKWWDWSDEKILKNKDLFEGEITADKLLNIL